MNVVGVLSFFGQVYTQLAPEVEKDLKRFNQLHKDVGDLKARIKAYERSA